MFSYGIFITYTLFGISKRKLKHYVGQFPILKGLIQWV
jgi:hypothetical protein